MNFIFWRNAVGKRGVCAWFTAVVLLLSAASLLKAADPAPLPASDVALLAAATRGDAKAVGEALAAGAKIEVRDKDGQTPLMLAVASGSEETVAFLIKREARVNARGPMPDGYTPLCLAAAQNQTNIMELLIAHGAKVNLSARGGTFPLLNAIATGNEAAAQLLIMKGADLNMTAPEYISGGCEYPLLSVASYNNHLNIVKLLLTKGAPVNARDQSGATALCYAAGHADIRLLRTLLEAKADPNLATLDGMTPLIYAADSGSAAKVAMLLQAGANPQATATNITMEGGD